MGPRRCRATRAVFSNDRLQIVAVILCSTGVALLAYMDAGITNKKKTMTGVLLAALAAAGSAVYKVSTAGTYTAIEMNKIFVRMFSRYISIHNTIKEVSSKTGLSLIRNHNHHIHTKNLQNRSFKIYRYLLPIIPIIIRYIFI